LISQTAGAAITNLGGNIFNEDPLLDPKGLQFNGGPTETIALLKGSPAIDAVPKAFCTDLASPPRPLTIDQRGLPRPDIGEAVFDVGAYEFQDSPPFAGTPGKANCHGKSVSALAHQFGNLDAAASALDFSSVKAMQAAIRAFCGG
jgi:hypothetical protein